MKNRIYLIILIFVGSCLPVIAQNQNGGVSSYQLLNEFRRNQKKAEKGKKKKSNKVETEKKSDHPETGLSHPSNKASTARKRVTESTVNASVGEIASNHHNTSSKGAKSYLTAAEEGDADAQFNLGMCYYYGDGVEEDRQKAIDWMTKSARQNHGQAQLWIGKIYLAEEHDETNSSEAAKWLKKAANQDIAEAQYLLALLYKEGNGVLQDPTLARQWMEKAATNGWKDAIKELENLN